MTEDGEKALITLAQGDMRKVSFKILKYIIKEYVRLRNFSILTQVSTENIVNYGNSVDI